uniref:Phosphoseryl-tRNA kinase n=1 Tax=Phasianus colchicus TaxID=9054 RepID=A0A669PWB2_PHACC
RGRRSARGRSRRLADGGRVVLCVLCGLPAAGKSTLARALRRQLPLRQGWDCALLVYDDLIPEEAWGRGANPAPRSVPQDSAWKRRRRELLRLLERFLRALRSGPAPPGPAPPGWSRFLSCCAEQGLRPGRDGGGPRVRPLCIVLDDNFYYRSMRYEVFQLAREYSLGFCQLFLECPLELCLQRNRLRGSPVPEGTICRMAQRVELPEPEKNPWEQNSLILSCSACTPEEQCDAGLMEEADRAICAASTVHQADQTCRRIISQTMKEAKDKNVLPSELKSLAEELNKLKAEFLEDLRQGSHVENESGQQNPTTDPATSVLSSFQLEATNVINKYILK